MRRLVVLSGAGISTDSGIRDFRGASGTWTLDPAAQHRNTYRNFLTDPDLRAAYWRSRYQHPWHAEPNAGHYAVADLTNSDIDTTVITQNTDGLHQRAGTPPDRVVEVHGTMHVVICIECGNRSPTSDVITRIASGEAVPQCLQCGGILKTASTMFGQTMPPEVYAEAERAGSECDLLLAVGTSLNVEPVGSLCASAVRAGATLVIANRDPTPYDGIATEIIRDPLSDSLPRIADLLLTGEVRADTKPERVTNSELTHLRRTAAEHRLDLSTDAVVAAAAAAILCGATDQDEALAALRHIPELEDVDIRLRAARWLQGVYPSAASGSAPYWDDSMPDEPLEDLVTGVVTPRFLMRMLTETTDHQDRRTLTVLTRAAATRPDVQTCLVELLSVLPGLSPAAIDAAVAGGHPEPLSAALVSLVRNAALPAELLDAVPRGTTELGEFPVLLAESLVDAYEARIATHPDSAPRGLVRMLIELAERLADQGRSGEAVAAAQRAAQVTEGLTEKLDLPARAAASLRRARELDRQTH